MVDTAQKDYDHLFKLIIIGDSGCGKSCLLLRFVHDSYGDDYVSTVGVDFKFRSIQVKNKNVKLQIWDTAGQERFRNITSTFYRGAHGVILVYDITNEDSFRHVKNWLKDVERYYDSPISCAALRSPCVALIGNKVDLEEKRVIDRKRAEDLAQKHNLIYFEASAKNSHNVNAMFSSLVSRIMEAVARCKVEKIEQQKIDTQVSLLLSEERKRANSCCG